MRCDRLVMALLATALLHPSASSAQVQKKDVQIESGDGFTLAGRYYSTGVAGPGLMLLHQCNREEAWTGYEGLAPLLAQHGFNVLELDFRGFGGSRSELYPEWRSQMDVIAPLLPADVEAAHEFLAGQRHVDAERLAVVGASCGASQGILLARQHSSVKALVLLSGSLWPGAREAFDETRQLPVFIATSEDDPVTESMRALFAASQASESRFVLYKGALHGTPLFDLDRGLEMRIVEWLSESLDATKRNAP